MIESLKTIPQIIQKTWKAPFCQKAARLAEIVAQLAARIFFVGASLFIAAALLPLNFQAVGIPVIAITSTILSAFWFQKEELNPESNHLYPLMTPVVPLQNGKFPPDFPIDAPRGFMRKGQNCGINAGAHYLDSDPEISQWLRLPPIDTLDLEPFIQRLDDYDAPNGLKGAFRAYAADQPRPLLSMPRLFNEFMENYAAPPHEQNLSEEIKNQIHKLSVLTPALYQFYQANDQAIQENLGVSQGDSQTLREAMSRVSQIEKDNAEQLDGEEIIRTILQILPNRLKTRIRTTRQLDESQYPKSTAQPRIVEEQVDSFPLRLAGCKENPTLENLFESYRKSNMENDPNATFKAAGIDGVIRQYPIKKTVTALLDPPPAFRFHIVRESFEKPVPEKTAGSTSLYSRIANFICCSSRPKTKGESGFRKLQIPVDIPSRFSIQLNGQAHYYRLSSFVNHEGSYQGGHYTAAKIVNGNRYILNDHRVTLVKEEHEDLWKDRLSQASLLYYVREAQPQGAALDPSVRNIVVESDED